MSERVFSDMSSLGLAREWLREQAMGNGATCPCCRQFAKVYKRSLNARMARALILAWRKAGVGEPVNMPSLQDGGGDPSKLRYWGLIAEIPGRREDGGHAGWWLITDQGAAFARGLSRVLKYALVYDGRLLRLDGPEVHIQDCLGKKFNLQELLADRADSGVS